MMKEIDIRGDGITNIRFADGEAFNNTVHVQDYHGDCLAVIMDSEGKECEIECEDVDNLIMVLQEFKRRVNR